MVRRFLSSARGRAAAGSMLLASLAAGMLLTPAAPALANDCSSPTVTLPFALSFDGGDQLPADPGCVVDKDNERTGFTGFQNNSGKVGNPPAVRTALQPALIDRDNNASLLTLTATTTISGSQFFGSNFGITDNTQVNALETTFSASAPGTATTKVFTIETTLRGRFGLGKTGLSYLDTPQDQAAVYFGPDEDNFVKLGVLARSDGLVLEFIDEQKQNTSVTRELFPAKQSVVNINTISNTLSSLNLMLVGDQESGKITAYYNTGLGIQKMPNDVTLTGASNVKGLSRKDQFFFSGSKAGILVVQKNNKTPIGVDFDSFSIRDAQRPGANAGADINVTSGTQVALDGSKSAAPAGRTVASYGWTQVGGPTVQLQNPTNAKPTFQTPSAAGVFTFSLVVTDSTGVASTPDEVQVSAGDIPISGLDLTVSGPTTLGQPTVFNTSIVTGTNVNYTWNFGNGQVVPNGGATISTTYASAGSYTAVVSATNNQNQGTPITASVVVEVRNLPPVAVAGSNQSVVVGAPVSLSGAGSSDPDGHLPLSYSWTQIGAPAVTLNGANTISPSFTAPATPAELTFQLIVSDSRGATSEPVTVKVTVGDISVNAVQAATSSPTVLGATTTFTGSATGSNLIYSWDFGDGAIGTGQNATHVYSREGTFPVTLTVTNSSGTRSANTTVQVTNTAPTANAGADQSVQSNDAVTLSGSGSDPDGHLPLTYSWRQINGAPVTLSGTGANRTFTAPATSGKLVFELTVTDARGKSSTDTIDILVNVSNRSVFVYLPLVMRS